MAQTQGMPIAPGPTTVSGLIDADTIWYAGASPHILESDVIVKDNALLTIEPGTEIKSKDRALIVEGRISAQGDNDHIIRFDSIQDDKLWPGITFAGVKDRKNKLAFVRIRNARTAVNCQASSPIIELSEFTQNNEAIKIQGAFSKPLISKNAVYKNRGIAISVSDGAAPRILNNSIQDNDNAGLMIHSSATEIAQNTIARNKHNDIVVKGAQTLIRQNNLIDNQLYNMAGEMTGMSVKALDNWWGASPPDPKMIRGENINIRPYLNKETPDAFKESR